ncbi:MAG: transketolase C-terminal domain-containing protein [Gemmatimonadales bacterium]
MRDAFVRALETEAEHDARIMLITGDLGFGVLDGYAERRPSQFLNAGVAEQNMTGVATGLAMAGRVVFTYSIGNFPILRCLEQIRNDAAYHDANVNVVSIGAGFSYGVLGMSHHATEDLAIMRALPGIVIASPADPWEMDRLVPWLAGRAGTTYLRLDKSSAGLPADPDYHPERTRTVRAGDAATLVGTGGVLGEVMSAADLLAADGVEARVLAVTTLRPFDAGPVLSAARETPALLTVEEHVSHGGLGGLVAETLLEAGAAPRVFRRLGIPDTQVGIVGGQEYLRAACGLDAAGIAKATREALGRA